MLFAQEVAMKRADDEAVMMLLAMVGAVILVGLAILFFFCKNLSDMMKQVSPRNRTTSPGSAFFYMIPLFNIIWGFIYPGHVKQSLDNEYADRGWENEGDFGKSVGQGWAICNILGVIPILGLIFSIGGFVCFIMFWVKTAGFKNRLIQDGYDRADEPRDYESDRDDYDQYDQR